MVGLCRYTALTTVPSKTWVAAPSLKAVAPFASDAGSVSLGIPPNVAGRMKGVPGVTPDVPLPAVEEARAAGFESGIVLDAVFLSSSLGAS